MVSVYYDQYNKNNLVSYAKDRLGEVRENQVDFGILLEIGYHDDYNDAFWIVNNMENIANAIVKALNSYYGYWLTKWNSISILIKKERGNHFD